MLIRVDKKRLSIKKNIDSLFVWKIIKIKNIELEFNEVDIPKEFYADLNLLKQDKRMN